MQIINNYIVEHQTTIIDIDIVRKVVNNYVKQNIYKIFDVNILNQLVVNYFEQNQTIINQYISQNAGIIKNVEVNDEYCIVTLNNGNPIQLAVYDVYANIRDRVQSIVVVPNSDGHVSFWNDILTYLVTPASMASVIAQQQSSGQMTVEYLLLDANGGITTQPVSSLNASSDGRLTIVVPFKSSSTIKSIALHVKDNKEGGSDYVTTFVPIDYIQNVILL